MNRTDLLSLAENILKKVTRLSVRPYSNVDFGREKYEGARSVIAKEPDVFQYLAKVRKKINNENLIAFVGTQMWLGNEKHEGFELVVCPGKSKIDALRIAQSNAINYDMETEDLVKWFEEKSKIYDFDIFIANTDTVVIDFLEMPNDVKKFAEEAYEFCPDIVDQNFNTLNAFVESIEATGMVSFWWD